MKILLIHQYFKDKGATGGLRFNEMVKVWRDEGHEITVIAGDLDAHTSTRSKEYKGNFVTKKDQDGIEVWRCYVSESYNTNFLGRLWAYFSFVFSGIFAGIFKAKGKYDVIVVSSPPLFVGITAYLISLIKRTPFVFEVRDLWPESAIDTGVLKNKLIIKFAFWFERFIYKKATKINVLTPAFRKILIKEKGVDENKIIMIPNAADFEITDKLLTSFDVNAFRNEKNWGDKFVITYVGAHGVANGLHQILETAELLKDTSVTFVMVGAGMKKEELKKKAIEENINNVIFYDPVPKEDALKYIMASEIGASVLLKNDTFKTVYSNKTFDYMSCKKPIFMAIDGVSRDLVEEARAGIFVEPENPKDFAHKIRQYLKDPQRIKKEGENGYHFAKKNFDRIYLAKEYLSHLVEVVNNK